MNLTDKIIEDLKKLALEYGIAKIVLFGSRARGDNGDKSDVDIAVYGCSDFVNFKLDVEEKVWTLLTFDIVNMDESISEELAGEIRKDGVAIYEKV